MEMLDDNLVHRGGETQLESQPKSALNLPEDFVTGYVDGFMGYETPMVRDLGGSNSYEEGKVTGKQDSPVNDLKRLCAGAGGEALRKPNPGDR